MGKPFTSLNVIQTICRVHRRNFDAVCFSDQQYFSHYAIDMQIKHLLQMMIANYSINQLPFYRNEQDEYWTRKFDLIGRIDLKVNGVTPEQKARAYIA